MKERLVKIFSRIKGPNAVELWKGIEFAVEYQKKMPEGWPNANEFHGRVIKDRQKDLANSEKFKKVVKPYNGNLRVK